MRHQSDNTLIQSNLVLPTNYGDTQSNEFQTIQNSSLKGLDCSAKLFLLFFESFKLLVILNSPKEWSLGPRRF